ncbi:hypothetical protein PanWU01x14_096470 [Parasponia andersonii]|uniref:Transmembrane protein n=1 Tax=Parasponia andersonii TaxID=3476 RepID=A0A2P5D4X3_PARAD|nr:hypothetical protein PanWU01x14_096470 [Parasponia andersonii]
MLKQSPSRNQRSKGFKVKHVLQICLLLAICIWLLYQVKHSHDKNKAFEDSSSRTLAKMHTEDEIIKLGRRDLHPRVETPFKIENHEEKEEYSKEEVEESKLAESDNEEGRGGGDDEIDGHDQERAEEEESEEVEDLIDEEGREREEGIEEQESEDKGIDFDDVKSFEDQTENEGKSNNQEAREEHYKDDDASSAVMQNVQTISGILRKVKEEKVWSAGKDEVEKETETYHTQGLFDGAKDLENKAHRSLTATTFASANAREVGEMDHELDSTRLDTAMYSTSLLEAESNELTKVKNESVFLLLKDPTLNGTITLPELKSDLNLSSKGRHSYLGTILGKLNENPEVTSVQKYSNLTLSVFEDSDATEKEVALNGLESIVPEENLQFGEAAETEKSSATTTSNENSVVSEESKTNDGLQSGEESLKILASNKNLDATEIDSSDSSDFSFYQEDGEGHSVMSSL